MSTSTAISVPDVIDGLVQADRLLATTALDEAAGGDPKKVADGHSELARAEQEVANGHLDGAASHFRNAWSKADAIG